MKLKSIYQISSIVLFFFLFISCKTEKQEEWISLFDGKTLKGWVLKEAEGKFYVEDGMIVSVTDENTPNCYLATEEYFSDFILELDFKIESPLNSGVNIRSKVRERDSTLVYINGRMEPEETTFPAGMMVGYQIEIDPSERAWTGGLYEPGGRGWLQNLEGKPEAQQAYKKDDWNHFKIVAQGNRIQTWINNVQAINTTDDLFKSGFIGFQMHSVYNEEQAGKKMFWKNIRIKEL